MTNERTQAVALANRLLDEPNCDPDDDLRVLSRQLLRAVEVIDRVRADEPSRKPDGYAYRYPSVMRPGETYISFSHGEEINASKPIEAVPYYFGSAVNR